MGRRAPCDPLARKGSFLDPLARIPLLVHPRLAAFTGEDITKLRKNQEAEENYGLFRQVLSELGDEQLKASHEALGRIAASLRRTEALFREKGGGEVVLDFDPAYQAIAEMQKSLTAFYSEPVAADLPEGGEPQDSAPAGRGRSGRIDGREDVMRALDEIADYYRRKEPSSPVLPLLERAKAWVSMSFLEVLGDIAPESVGEAKRVLVVRPPS